MWSIDFLITLSLLNNQATANALVIVMQLSGKVSEGKPFSTTPKDIRCCVAVYHLCCVYTTK